ncbi:MAG: beta-xylosidase family glycoside hydrolase [Planctomycetota bacterium]|jgi:hypothetical protein
MKMICLLATTLIFIPFASAVDWQLVKADVDWDGISEEIKYTTDGASFFYPWRAPIITGKSVYRVKIGLENLREQVYYYGEKVLDEGYFDYPLGSKYETLYDSKVTNYSGYFDVLTTWTAAFDSNELLLKRYVRLKIPGATIRYECILNGENAGDVGFDLLWHDTYEQGTPEDSFAYIKERIENYSESYPGLSLDGLSFKINYSFDDSLKEIEDGILYGWDGANLYDFNKEEIDYDDIRYSPLTRTRIHYQQYGSPAIFGIVHSKATMTDFTLRNGELIDDTWYGVGPRKRYTQEVSVEYEYYDHVNIDIKPMSCPNPLNVNSSGIVPVALLGSEDLDVMDIDPGSVELEGVSPIHNNYENVGTISDECSIEGPDGYLDMTLEFNKDDVIAAIGEFSEGDELELTLAARLNNGRVIRGYDDVIIIFKKSLWKERVFLDEFSHSKLSNEWNWYTDYFQSSNFTLINDSLVINADKFSGWYEGMIEGCPRILMNSPEGDYNIVTKLKYNGDSNKQGAGIVIYDGIANLLLLTRIYDNGDKIQFVNFRNGVEFMLSEIDCSNDVVWLQISKIDDSFFAYYSMDGTEFIEIPGICTPIIPYTDEEIGLIAAAHWGPGFNTKFDFFKLEYYE